MGLKKGRYPQVDESVLRFIPEALAKQLSFFKARDCSQRQGEIAKIPRVDLTKFKAKRGLYDHFTEKTDIKISYVLSEAASWC